MLLWLWVATTDLNPPIDLVQIGCILDSTCDKTEGRYCVPVEQLIIHTVRGSTIESLGNGWYWACDADHHCRRVEGLWEAQTMIREAEVHNRPLV